MAVSVEHLPEGTVKFEDVSKDTFQGTVDKVFSRAKRQEQLNGKVLYSTNDGTSELPYGEKDVLGEFTILPGDVVGFKIATGKIHNEQSFWTKLIQSDHSTLSLLLEQFAIIYLCHV